MATCFAEAAGALLQGLGGHRGSVGVEARHLKCELPWECQKPRLYRPSMEAVPGGAWASAFINRLLGGGFHRKVEMGVHRALSPVSGGRDHSHRRPILPSPHPRGI